ncbi:MAG: HAD family hydrolase [Myxococcales bacterium]|nr:HAD family hydrolase [Myxococcales bacterium]
MTPPAIPFALLDTVFLDAGNTLFSMDFELMSEQLALLGPHCAPDRLARAEAAARPAVSARIAAGGSTESRDTFRFYLRKLLAGALETDEAELDRLAQGWAGALSQSSLRVRLWVRILPGVPETLAALRKAGLRLVVVSNSDGTIESTLTRAKLRPLLDAVVDSAQVGFEKPHPAIFRHALELVRARAEHTLHVGDLYAADVEGARSVGIHALLLDPFGDWPDVDCPTQPDLPSVGRQLLAARS